MWQAPIPGQMRFGPAGGRRCDDSQSHVCPMQFCGTIVLIFFLELAVAVLAFLFQDWVRDRFREFFESNIRSYRDDIDLQNLIDSLQKAVSTAGAGLPGRAWASLAGDAAPASASREPGASLLSMAGSGEAVGGAAPASGQFSFARSWLPGCVGVFTVCPPPLAWGRWSSCPCGHPPPGPRSLRSQPCRWLQVPRRCGYPGAERLLPPACDSPSEAIPVPFLPGTFSPSCLRGQSCLEEASPDGEECDLPGICPQGAV